MTEASQLKGFTVGDLVYKKQGYHTEGVIDTKRVGVIVELGRRVGVGFQSIFVMWSDTQEVDEIVENYLHKVHES